MTVKKGGIRKKSVHNRAEKKRKIRKYHVNAGKNQREGQMREGRHAYRRKLST